MNKKFLIVLFIIIIIVSLLLSCLNYLNIEKFSNLSVTIPSDLQDNSSSKLLASLATPKKKEPINFSCYDYLKNVKKWNPDNFSDTQKKVIFSLRRLYRGQLGNINSIQTSLDSCVIPVEHFPIFNIDENSKNSISFSIDYKENDKTSKKIILPFTDEYSFPQGIVLDFSNNIKSKEIFLAIIDYLYKLYDSDFLKEIEELKEEIVHLNNSINDSNKNLDYLNAEIQKYNNMINKLNDPNSECQIKKRENAELRQEIDSLQNNINDLTNQINTIIGNIKNDQQKIYELSNC